jgi:TRAP-type C4-dicarboxylate transport system substrate-binding protein|tara:strand:+ start:102 stop:233 length:132 start_codon:yes stop_codon:yes gene_type:complete
MKIVTPSKSDIEAFKKASKPVYEAYKNNAGKLGAQLLDAASKL